MPISTGAGLALSAGIGGAGALGSALIGSNAAGKASRAQMDAANNALSFQKGVYESNKGNLQPWINNGSNAMYSLASLYGLPTPQNPQGGAAGVNAGWEAFKGLDAYKFPFEQGNLALERQLNAQGRTQSGAQARATQQFGQGLASQYMMSNYVNPLMQMSGQGQQAAGALAGYGNQSAQQIGNSFGNFGTAQASGIMGQGNAMAGGVNGLSNSLQLYSMLAQNNKGGSSSPTYSGGGGGGYQPTDGWGNALNNGWSGGQWS